MIVYREKSFNKLGTNRMNSIKMNNSWPLVKNRCKSKLIFDKSSSFVIRSNRDQQSIERIEKIKKKRTDHSDDDDDDDLDGEEDYEEDDVSVSFHLVLFISDNSNIIDE